MNGLAVGIVCLLVGLVIGAAGYAGNIDSDCKNVGSSYTAKYKLICEVKK